MATFKIFKSETGTDMLINLDNVDAIYEFNKNSCNLYFSGDDEWLRVQGNLKKIIKQICKE